MDPCASFLHGRQVLSVNVKVYSHTLLEAVPTKQVFSKKISKILSSSSFPGLVHSWEKEFSKSNHSLHTSRMVFSSGALLVSHVLIKFPNTSIPGFQPSSPCLVPLTKAESRPRRWDGHRPWKGCHCESTSCSAVCSLSR